MRVGFRSLGTVQIKKQYLFQVSNMKASLGRKLRNTLPKPTTKKIIYSIRETKKKKKKTHSHLFNSASDVLTERIFGSPASVTLKSISVLPSFHKSQVGVTSEGSHFMVALSVSTKLRNDSEKDFTNGVILIFALSTHKKKR